MNFCLLIMYIELKRSLNVFTCKYYITTGINNNALTECFVPRYLSWHKIGHVPSYFWLLSDLSQHCTQV